MQELWQMSVQVNAEGLLLAVLGLRVAVDLELLDLADQESSCVEALVINDEGNLAQRKRKQILAVRCNK
jgi:hypothetical protein